MLVACRLPVRPDPRYGELGIAGLNYDECPGERPSSLLTGFLAMEMAHTDPSMATFFGVHVGLAMGSIAHCGSVEQRLRWLPDMALMNKIGAFARALSRNPGSSIRVLTR